MSPAPWDVVIVGAGAGGGTVAAALAPLARAGRRILVLEHGPRWRPDDDDLDELLRAERLYEGAGATFTADGTIALSTGRLLGGSTAISTGVAMVPSSATIAAWQVPELDGADVERRARVFGEACGAQFLPDAALNENNRLFAEGATRAGYSPTQVRLLVRGCRGAGVCHLGCPNGAVQGTHLVQLPAAEAAGVQVVTGAEVLRVSQGQLVVRVHAGTSGPWPPGEQVIDAACIVLAAGTLHTAGLLLRAGLGEALPRVGRGVTCHPSHVIVAEHGRAITNAVGHPTSFLVDHTLDHGYGLEPCFSSPLVTARNLTGFGDAHAQVLAVYPRLQMLRATARDHADDDHRVRLDREGVPRLHYRWSPQLRATLVAAQRAAARVAFAAGAVRVHVSAADPPRLDRADIGALERRIDAALELPGRVSLSATQPLGGAAMGRGPRDSVTDAWGRVHGAPWLRVADGALCPDSPGLHPMLTIMALADRVAEGISRDLPTLDAARRGAAA